MKTLILSTKPFAVCVTAVVLGISPAAFANDQISGQSNPPVVVPAKFKTAAQKTAKPATQPTSFVSDDAPWWRIFHDAALEKLEHDAITTNQDLRQSIARVVQARAEARVAAADFFPMLTAPMHATRERTTNTGPVITSRLVGDNSFLPKGGPDSFEGQALTATYNDFQAQLSLSYEVDVFGRIRHTYGQAEANARASAADRQAIQLSLTSQVAANYFTLRALDSEVAVLQGTIHLRADAVHIQQERVKAGAASDIDLSRAQLEEANAEADLSDAIQQRAESENALAVLCGEPASTFHIDPKPLGQIAPPPVPAAVPAQLLTQRPDLIEARHRLTATSEGIGAAHAKFLPTFNISANYGYESAEFGQLLEDQSHTWSITGGVSIPIFEGGRNAANLKAAQAQREQAVASYQQTALTAFAEAENALSALRQRTIQAEARGRAADSARKVFDAAQKSYQEGAINYFEVIDSERVLLSAEVSQVQTLNARYAATIDLIRAMGGGYGGTDAPAKSSSNVKYTADK